MAESHQLGERDRRVSHHAGRGAGFTSARDARPDGAPNIVRGGSHSGNVAAHQLASHGLLDILSSDYYPASLLDAAFRIADAEDNAFTLPQAIRLVSQHPAQALGLDDRGVIAEGNAPTWCWRTVAANISRSTMSGAGERGSFNAGKLIWLVGPRLR